MHSKSICMIQNLVEYHGQVRTGSIQFCCYRLPLTALEYSKKSRSPNIGLSIQGRFHDFDTSWKASSDLLLVSGQGICDIIDYIETISYR